MGAPVFIILSASISNIHHGLFIIVSSLVDFPVGGERRFTSLVGNVCAKLISASHAVRKHEGFSTTDKKTRHTHFGKAALLKWK